jgi:formylmethanofuran:tetrahydromethanopterin formyltransferase
MERVKGIEPSFNPSKSIVNKGDSATGNADYTQIRAHASGASCPDLAKVVASWEKLPASLKAAILAIVGSVVDSSATSANRNGGAA